MKTMKSKTGSDAFYVCSLLSQVTLTSGLTVIGQYMFGSTFLLAIVIPSTVTSIGFFNNYISNRNENNEI